MKSINKYILIPALVMGLPVISLLAQGEIVFSPADLIPHQEGYYVAGVNLDLNGDEIMEFYNGCFDGYENPGRPQDNHHESGAQQNFRYMNCMIMPTCTHKNEPIEPPVHLGYIQLAPSSNLGTDSAVIGAILTPPVMNLQHLLLETSSDVSIQDWRPIIYNIEYSKDNELTWEASFIQDHLTAQGGYRVTYSGESHLEFEEMVNASKTGPITIRISTNDVKLDYPNKGWYVKVHYLSLMADLYTAIDESRYGVNNGNLRINERTVVSDYPVRIFNSLGQTIGTGKMINVPSSGIYFVLLPSGVSQKIFIR